MGTGRGIFVVAVAVALALVVAGCGSGDSSTSTVSGSISKAAFIKKVDAVCQKGTERMQRAILVFLKQHKDVKRPNKAQSLKLVGTAIVPSVRTEIKELKALEVPEGDEERVDAIIGALEEGLETAEGNPEAVVSSSDAVFGISGRLAGEYGAEVCGSR
jgi:ABC-type phosphate/phosphonate transport system substrate-binding protein